MANKKAEKKKKKPSDIAEKVDANRFQLTNVSDETQEIKGGNKKSKKLKYKKTNSAKLCTGGSDELDASHTYEVERSSNKRESESVEDKLKKSTKKKGRKVESKKDLESESQEDILKKSAKKKRKKVEREKDFESESAADKLNKSTKRKRKKVKSINRVDEVNEKENTFKSRNRIGETKYPETTQNPSLLLANDLPNDNLMKNMGEDTEDEVLEMSSGDEDHSIGMRKWITQYHQSRPGLRVLQTRIDEFIIAHEAQEEQAKREREEKAEEGGWTVVVHHKGRKKTTDAESGVAVGSVAQAAVLDKMTKKKKKEVGLDFYRFQKREAHRNDIMMLQSKFEQDKKRIQEMRAARKFRPY